MLSGTGYGYLLLWSWVSFDNDRTAGEAEREWSYTRGHTGIQQVSTLFAGSYRLSFQIDAWVHKYLSILIQWHAHKYRLGTKSIRLSSRYLWNLLE